MTIVPDTPKNREYLFTYSLFIVSWNHLEYTARDLLLWLTGGNIAASILSHQTGNASLTDAIRVSSAWTPDAEEHLVHFTKMMDIIRAYRNYYVHNLLDLTSNDDGEAIGTVMGLNVKGGFKLHETPVSLSDLQSIYEQCEDARAYGDTLHSILKSHPQMVDRAQPLASLEKPVLPKTLSKSVVDPQGPIPPRQS